MYTSAYKYIHIHVRICICMRMYAFVYMSVNVFICIGVPMYVYVYKCMYVCTHIIFVHIHAFALLNIFVINSFQFIKMLSACVKIVAANLNFHGKIFIASKIIFLLKLLILVCHKNNYRNRSLQKKTSCNQIKRFFIQGSHWWGVVGF